MKEPQQQKEEMAENRMLLPEISTGAGALRSYAAPNPYESMTARHDRLQPAATTAPEEKLPPLPHASMPSGETTKDFGLRLAPGAMAVLQDFLSGKRQCKTPVPSPVAKPEGAMQSESRGEARSPVIKMSTGAFLVTPTPPVSLSFANRPSFPRMMPNAAPLPVGLPSDQVPFKTPERRINVQNAPRPTMSAPPRSPVSAYLVHSPGGPYRILSAGEVATAEGRMIPMEQKRPGSVLAQPTVPPEIKSLFPQSLPPPHQPHNPLPQLLPHPQPPHPMMYVKPMKTTVSLAPKLQTAPTTHIPRPHLAQKLLERAPNPVFMEPSVPHGNFAAAAENLKNRFMIEDRRLPVSPNENLRFSVSPTDIFAERSDAPHKRRKTSTPASLDAPPLPIVQQPGLELLLRAAKTLGDRLPFGPDLQYRRSSARSRKSAEGRSFSSRLAHCLDPALRRTMSVLDNFAGVYPLADGSFVARCRFKGCYVLIGTFKTAEDAARAYDRVVLSIRGRRARTNFAYSEYLNFELQNAKRAFEAKYKQCERTRRGSAWPWARAAQTLLANDEEGSDDGVQELVHNTGPLKEDVPGKSVFELLQHVMMREKDLNGTFDLIQAKIRQLQDRITSGMSTEDECDCVGQYAYAASILGRLVSMQKEWERKHQRQGIRAVTLGRSPSPVPTDRAESDPHQVTPLTPKKHHSLLSCRFLRAKERTSAII